MHGIIFQQLQQYIQEHVGPGAWSSVAGRANLHFKVYLASSGYPAEELQALLDAVAEEQQAPLEEILEGFGTFIVPGLMQVHGDVVDPKWCTLEVIEQVSRSIFPALRKRDSSLELPKVTCKRKSTNLMVVDYVSPRRMCAMAIGIIKGIAAHRGETVTVNELACVETSGKSCQFLVRRIRL